MKLAKLNVEIMGVRVYLEVGEDVESVRKAAIGLRDIIHREGSNPLGIATRMVDIELISCPWERVEALEKELAAARDTASVLSETLIENEKKARNGVGPHMGYRRLTDAEIEAKYRCDWTVTVKDIDVGRPRFKKDVAPIENTPEKRNYHLKPMPKEAQEQIHQMNREARERAEKAEEDK